MEAQRSIHDALFAISAQKGDGHFADATSTVDAALFAISRQARDIGISFGAGVIEIGVADPPIDMLITSTDCQI